jgi:hypothetical protein
MADDADALVQDAIRAYRAGDKDQARSLLDRALEIDDRNEQAWLWLSGLEDTDEDRRICLDNVLIINPNNEDARRGLKRLESSGTPPPPQKSTEEAYSRPFYDEDLDDLSPTETSSASANHNPADEISSTELDDWVTGLELGGGKSSVEDSRPSDISQTDNAAFASVFADAFEDVFDDDDFEDEPDNTAPFTIARDDDEQLKNPRGELFGDDAFEADDAFSDDDFLSSGPFEVSGIAEDFDLETRDQSRPTSPVPADLSPPARQSPGPRSPGVSSGDIFAGDAGTSVDEPDSSVYFQTIPAKVQPTRLPGTNERYPLTLIIGLLVVVMLNIGAVALLVINLGG